MGKGETTDEAVAVDGEGVLARWHKQISHYIQG